MPTLTDDEQISALAAPLQLPCGLELQNRLVKAAMEEMLGTGNGLPSELDCELYRTWAEGGYGMILSGNVQISPEHLGTPLDLVVPSSSASSRPAALAAFSSWASSLTPSPSFAPTKGKRPVSIMQLNHAGRQSVRFFCGRSPFKPALAPSAVPMTSGSGPLGRLIGRLVWGMPKEMSEGDIDDVVASFVRGAKLAKESGWDGVQLHASHGYLLAQFMSPKVNRRTDLYGGTARKRLNLLFRIVDAIRAEFPQESGFCLGIKLNSSDYVKGGLTEQDALDNVKWIAEHGGVDFIEISGGSYENPEFLNASPTTKPSTALREAFFDAFSQRAHFLLSTLPPSTLPSPPPLILLTGGFRTRLGMSRAVHTSSKSPTADLIGLGRPAAADPHLPRKLLNPDLPGALAKAPEYDSLSGVRALKWLLGSIAIFGPGLDVLYHTLLMRQIALEGLKKRRTEREKRKGAGKAAKVDEVEDEERRLCGFWVLVWRVYVQPLVPRWLMWLLGALVVALLGGRKWSGA
ncbi:hypothetical protein JCM5296_003460 [Sporobolomyces johnsonii]